MKLRQLPKLTETIETPTNTLENITFKDFSEAELDFWKQYGIKKTTLETFNVVSIQQFHAKNRNDKTYAINSSELEPVYGYKHKHFIKIYRPNSELRFLFLGEKSDNYVFGLDHLPPRGDVLFISGGEKDVMTLHAHGFFAICFNSENATIPPEVVRKLSYRFRHIVLLYDVDQAGLDAATYHQQKLKDFDIKVMLMPLSGKKTEKDISDFFRLGHTAEELKTLFNQLLENLYAQTFAMLKSCEIDFKRPSKNP